MSKNLKIEGLENLEAALVAAASKTRKGAEEAIRQEVGEIREDARATVPVKSGEAREGIVGRSDGLDGEVEATARHSTFLEHGTFKDKPQPFMQPAAERSRKRLPARAGAIIKTYLEGRLR